MASSHLHRSKYLQRELTCPVCLEMYRDPCILTCGHTLCKQCLDRLKEQTDGRRFYCPECRQSHDVKTKSVRVLKLANIVEELRYQSTAGAAILCDYCPSADDVGSRASSYRSFMSDGEGKARDPPSLAFLTCLKCKVSMCLEHLRPHKELPAFRNHPLVDPLIDFWKRKCPTHDVTYSHYCLNHKAYVCDICCRDEHTGHDVKTMDNVTEEIKVMLVDDLCSLDWIYLCSQKKLKEQEKKERQTWIFLAEFLTELMVKFQDMNVAFVRQLHESIVLHHQANAAKIQENISKIHQDQARLEDVRCVLESFLLENDPFRLIEGYRTKGKEYLKKLQQNLSELEDTDTPPEDAMTLIKNQTNAFLREKLLSMLEENTASFNTLCPIVEEQDPVDESCSSGEDIRVVRVLANHRVHDPYISDDTEDDVRSDGDEVIGLVETDDDGRLTDPLSLVEEVEEEEEEEDEEEEEEEEEDDDVEDVEEEEEVAEEEESEDDDVVVDDDEEEGGTEEEEMNM